MEGNPNSVAAPMKTSPIKRRFRISYSMKFCLDFLCILLVGIPVLLYYLIGKPYKRGFFCDDESLKYPYKNSTVTNNVLYAVGILLPIGSMMIIETIHWRYGKKSSSDDQQVTLFGFDIHPLLWQYYKKIGIFLFGACVSQFTTDIAKYNIGRLRPHFFAICDPIITEEICKKYVINYTCRGTDEFRIKETKLSFPSGHSSFSAYCMVYLAVYLQARMTWRSNYLLRPVLQVFILYMAWFTALSRVSDYKHHWSDVLAGMLLGVIVALLVVKFFSDLFVHQKRQDTQVLPLNRDLTNYDACTLQMEEK